MLLRNNCVESAGRGWKSQQQQNFQLILTRRMFFVVIVCIASLLFGGWLFFASQSSPDIQPKALVHLGATAGEDVRRQRPPMPITVVSHCAPGSRYTPEVIKASLGNKRRW
jgi:hypothetical protein